VVKASLLFLVSGLAYAQVNGTFSTGTGGGGTVDPTTTSGDMIYRSDTGTTRLPKGTTGQCMKMISSTIPGWGPCFLNTDPLDIGDNTLAGYIDLYPPSSVNSIGFKAPATRSAKIQLILPPVTRPTTPWSVARQALASRPVPGAP
jgi:hypothetical protein